jgi:DNA repair protein RecO
MNEEKTEGILLQTIPYLGRKNIFKVFTQEHGLLSLIAKKIELQPFCVAEWVYIVKPQGLFSLTDFTIIDPLLELRKSFPIITAAGRMGREILQSQMPGKQGNLYLLLRAYFQKLPLVQNVGPLVASFLLKRLFHDGALFLTNTCSLCGDKALSLEQGESLCQRHKTPNSILFTEDEWATIHQLATAKTFQSLQSISISPLLESKIEAISRETP